MNTRNKLPVYLLIGAGLVVVAIVAAILANSWAKNSLVNNNSSSGTENQTVVSLEKNGFNPQSITVKLGTRVVWLNKSGITGSVLSDNHPNHGLFPILNLGSFEDGFSVQAVFDKAGTYTYHNHLIPTQKGTVIVE